MTSWEEPSNGDPRGDRRRSRGLRIRVLALVVLAVWVGLLFDPVVGPSLLRLAGLVAGVLGIMLVVMGLGWVGFGLFALADRLRSWIRRASQWPES